MMSTFRSDNIDNVMQGIVLPEFKSTPTEVQKELLVFGLDIPFDPKAIPDDDDDINKLDCMKYLGEESRKKVINAWKNGTLVVFADHPMFNYIGQCVGAEVLLRAFGTEPCCAPVPALKKLNPTELIELKMREVTEERKTKTHNCA